MSTTSISQEKIIYPERDGKPMGETDVHVNEIADLLKLLQGWYSDDAAVYVGANMLCYYEEGIPTSSFCPDVFVVFGVPKKRRRTYKLWEEKAPTVIFEVTSRESRVDDLGSKKYLYADLGVAEYFVYDPLKEYLRPALQGFRLKSGEYEPIEPESGGVLLSRKLALRMKLEDSGLVLIDAASGERLLRPLEERASRLKAEAEIERLRAELKKRKER